MTTPVAQLAAVTEAPAMENTYYGIPVAYIGEDGDMVALGHHTHRRALAAFNAHARQHCGLTNIADDPQAIAQWWLEAVSPGWATFTAPDDSEFLWIATPARENTPGAQPVTWLNV
ncbi:hypothetical protein ACIPVA_03615 [Streptomyces anulatus]